MGAAVPESIITGLPTVGAEPETPDAATSSVVGGLIERTPEDETSVVDTYPEITELVNADNWLQKAREAYSNQEADPAFKQALYDEVVRKKGLDEALKLFNLQEGATAGTGDTE